MLNTLISFLALTAHPADLVESLLLLVEDVLGIPRNKVSTQLLVILHIFLTASLCILTVQHLVLSVQLVQGSLAGWWRILCQVLSGHLDLVVSGVV